MKMTRQDLKGIVKECLVEILSEGLVSTQKSIVESKQQRPRAPAAPEPAQARIARPNTADKISFLPNREDIRRSNPPVVESHQNLARSLTSDPVLADIFADTARTGTYKQMNESGSRINHEAMVASAGDAAAKVMLNSDPTDIFGESAGKWAALAFSEKVNVRA